MDLRSHGFRVWGLGFRVWGLGFVVLDVRFVVESVWAGWHLSQRQECWGVIGVLAEYCV